MNASPVVEDVQEEYLRGPIAAGAEGGDEDIETPYDDDPPVGHPTHITQTCSCAKSTCCDDGAKPGPETDPEPA